MTKFIISPDSFKGTLTSQQAALIIAESLSRAFPNADIVQCPLADGGEGTAALLRHYLDDDQVLIESAELIGLNLPEISSLPVKNRGSSAIGDSILKALNQGKRRFTVALGGSATNDAGLGMLMSLGMEACDASSKPVEPTLAGLLKLDRIDISNMDKRLSESSFTALADVVSPLCGKKGATAIYGSQKGIKTSEVGRIDDAIAGFAAMCSCVFGFDVRFRERAGAAGGLGYALMLLGGQVVSGAEYVIHATGFRDKLADTDWIITGEGRSDMQTLQGKLPHRVALAARDAGVKVALLSGSIEKSALPDLEKVFDLIISAKPEVVNREEAMVQAEALLTKSAAQLAREINCEH